MHLFLAERILPSLGLFFFILVWGCQKIDFVEGDSAMLSISLDTLYFDTVFTTVGSATRSFKVYNEDKNRFVRIDRIELEPNSFFFLNANGVPGRVVEDIEIAPNDSIYIFVEVNIDPEDDLDNSPFVIQEDINIVTGSQSNKVVLEAWGQNAVYLPGKVNKGGAALLTCGGAELLLTDDRPYVIHGTLVVDSCAMRVMEGARIHFHGGLINNASSLDGALLIGPEASLVISGSAERPVVIRGDRLEPNFFGRNPQYQGISILQNSRGNSIQYALIQEGLIGVTVDSASTLEISNSRIVSTGRSGVYARAAEVQIVNSIIAANGGSNVLMEHGGKLDILYSTLVNYGSRQEYALVASDCFLSGGDTCKNLGFRDLNLSIVNSILMTEQDNAILLSRVGGMEAVFDFSFDHSLVKLSAEYLEENAEDLENFDLVETSITFDDLFEGGRSTNTFRLDSLSRATGFARPIPGISMDIDDYARDGERPDAGAFENRYK